MRKAVLELLQKTETEKNTFLKELVLILKKNKNNILKANQRDLAVAQKQNLSDAFSSTSNF